MTPHQIRQLYSTRNPATLNVLQFFSDSHLHPELKMLVGPSRDLAFEMVDRLPDGTDLILGLRALREATDAFLRQYLIAHNFTLDHRPITRANGENQL